MVNPRMLVTSTGDFQLLDMSQAAPQPYAIASHCWDGQEVNFDEWVRRNDLPELRQSAGYVKIQRFCELARSRGFELAWIDTCCIDKEIPSELGASINSMFDWYRRASQCYVYLHDFHGTSESIQQDFGANLGRSRWFKRGWTLQELIAPSTVIFYNSRWERIGTKHSLAGILSSITRIGEDLLRGAASLDDFSCAQKMSWAAHRETERIEDRAYSLLGIFGINMLINRGEDWGAFQRLQKTIVTEKPPDPTIFAWMQSGRWCPRYSTFGDIPICSMFAPTPDCFAQSSSIVRGKRIGALPPRSHFFREPLPNRNDSISTDQARITLKLDVREVQKLSGDKVLLEAALDCHDAENLNDFCTTIYLFADFEPFHRLATSWSTLAQNLFLSEDRILHANRVEPYFIGSIPYEKDRLWHSSAKNWTLLETCISPVAPGWDNFGVVLQNWRDHTRDQALLAQRRMQIVKSRFTRKKKEVNKTKMLKFGVLGLTTYVAVGSVVLGLKLVGGASMIMLAARKIGGIEGMIAVASVA